MPSGEESKTIHVDKVYYCNNNNHEFQNCLVKALKEAIQKETEIKTATQRLIYMGRILDNDLKRISE